MIRYKAKWKNIYFDITQILLRRGGGGAIGHHTIPIQGLIRRLTPKYSEGIIEEGLYRLIKKNDLLLWPRGTEKIGESSSLSINPENLNDLERYLESHVRWYERLKEIEKEFGYKSD